MKLKQLLYEVNQVINAHALKYAHPYFTFAVFGIITYPFYYFVWKYTNRLGYESLSLRLVTVFLCTLLALKDYWPKKFQQFFPLYWYLTLLYSLPFLFTFLLLKNHMSYIWSMNTMTVLVLSILLLDLAALFLILTIGILAGIGCFWLTGDSLQLPPNALSIFITYGSIVFFGSIFSYRKDQLKEAEKKVKKAEADSLKLKNEAHEANLKAQAAFIKTAHQVAHDIRSPLASLLMILKSCKNIPEAERIALREAGIRIGDIANNLLNQYRLETPKEGLPNTQSQLVLLSTALVELMTEKKFQYQSKAINFNYSCSQEGQFAFVKINLASFKRMISNVMNNAVDAIGNRKGEVLLKLDASPDEVRVIIEDNGKGMSPSLVEKIRNKIALTHGKEEGHGIGLVQVRETIDNNKGSLAIQSIEGKGTTIELIFPRVKAPSWFAEEIRLSPEDTIIILDDDHSIHMAWNTRFASILQQYLNIAVFHYEKGQQVLDFILKKKHDNSKILLLTDFELLKQPLNGLEVIEKAAIKRSILVTSHYLDEYIRAQAVQLGAKVLPKQLASEIPISINQGLFQSQEGLKKVDIVLVDDDKEYASMLIHCIFAENTVDYFEEPELFLKNIDKYAQDTHIYLDNNFSSGAKGIKLAKKLHTLGYTSLYLLSGDKFESNQLPPYLTSILKDDIDSIKTW